MKNLLWFILLLPSLLVAQTFVKVPAKMAYDSLYSDSRITADVWFNSRNSPNYRSSTGGSVDVDVYAIMKGQGTGKLTVEAYGLKRKQRDNIGQLETMVGDSVNVKAATAIDSSLWTIALEKLWANYFMYEGIRLVFKRTVADSIDIWYQLVIYKE